MFLKKYCSTVMIGFMLPLHIYLASTSETLYIKFCSNCFIYNNSSLTITLWCWEKKNFPLPQISFPCWQLPCSAKPVLFVFLPSLHGLQCLQSAEDNSGAGVTPALVNLRRNRWRRGHMPRGIRDLIDLQCGLGPVTTHSELQCLHLKQGHLRRCPLGSFWFG